MHTLSSGSEHTHTSLQRKLRTCAVVSSQHLSSCAPRAQAALSSVVGLTMPQHTQHSLIYVLLLWIAILSIVQVVFIVFFFTAGHHGLSQNSSAVASARKKQFQANNTPLCPFEQRKGLMLTYQAKEGNNGRIKWEEKTEVQGLVSLEKGGKSLKIKCDGSYFLYLRVTLSSCNATWGSQTKVSLKWEDKDTLLQGGINRDTCSTGFLGKVKDLIAGGTLEVIVNLPTDETINVDETHLDIIYMSKF